MRPWITPTSCGPTPMTCSRLANLWWGGVGREGSKGSKPPPGGILPELNVPPESLSPVVVKSRSLPSRHAPFPQQGPQGPGQQFLDWQLFIIQE